MSSQTLTRQGTRSDLKWQEKVSKRRTERQLPIGHGEYTVLYPPGLAKMALGLAENLGDNLPVLCTDDIFSGGSIDDISMAFVQSVILTGIRVSTPEVGSSRRRSSP